MYNVKKKWKSQLRQMKLKYFSLYFLFLLSTLGCAFLPTRVTAQNSSANIFSPPDDQGIPSGTDSAGSRSCQTAAKPMVVLTKTEHDSPTTILRLGYTTESHPTFYVYVPYQPEQIQSAKFSLRTLEEKQIYSKPLDIANTPGIIEIKLPEDAPGLKLGIWYQVYLFVNVVCSPQTPSSTEYSIAVVQRQKDPSLLSDLPSNPESLSLLARDFWYDRIATLAKQLTSQNQEQWATLLQEAGLEEYAPEPIVRCCTLQESQ